MNRVNPSDFLQELRVLVLAHPLRALALALGMIVLSCGDLMEIIPFFAPLVASPLFPFFHETHDILAVAVALYAAYKWHPAFGRIAIIIFLAAHVPYVFLKFSRDLPEVIRILFASFIGLFGVQLIAQLAESQAKARKHAAQLEQANHLKELFTDIMRHDLLNPTGTIRNFAELLVEEAKDEEQKESALAIKRNANRLIELIESASTYAKLESVEKLERKRLDLNEVFKGVVSDFSQALEEKNMKLEYLAKGKCHAMVNPMIENVFSNLLGNAIKYSPEGRKIEVNITDERTHCKIYVKDWGYGIAADDKQHIFQRFKRVDKKGVKGTGLGLAIVKRVVELHNGKVWVEDNTEGGSVFYVELPKS